MKAKALFLVLFVFLGITSIVSAGSIASDATVFHGGSLYRYTYSSQVWIASGVTTSYTLLTYVSLGEGSYGRAYASVSSNSTGFWRMAAAYCNGTPDSDSDSNRGTYVSTGDYFATLTLAEIDAQTSYAQATAGLSW